MQGGAPGPDTELVAVLVDEANEDVYGRSSSAWQEYGDALRRGWRA
jgi:hypothetical protein